MASRFHQTPRSNNNLFASYDQTRSSSSRPSSTSPNPYYNGPSSGGSAFSAYPGSGGAGLNGSTNSSFRSATPNGRGQYSDAVLSELESQNDEEVSEMGRKVAMLKDLTTRIGDEIRDSTALTEKMNDQFSNTSLKLKGTMKRMLVMAEKTGVGWKVWLAFFAAVCFLFWYVWLF